MVSFQLSHQQRFSARPRESALRIRQIPKQRSKWAQFARHLTNAFYEV